MAQFDVFNNPITAARAAYPFVLALQSDVAVNARDQIVAPMVKRNAISPAAGRLTPRVTMAGDDLVALIPALTSLRSKDLGKPLGSLQHARAEILAAIDFLFFGV
jgi:toxin CcdB